MISFYYSAIYCITFCFYNIYIIYFLKNVHFFFIILSRANLILIFLLMKEDFIDILNFYFLIFKIKQLRIIKIC